MQLLLVFCIVFLLNFKNITSETLEDQRKNHLNPLNEADGYKKDHDKRTIFSKHRHPGWTRHVTIHPSGMKYVLAYSPVGVKLVPFVKPHRHHIRVVPRPIIKPTVIAKPVIQQNGWKPVIPIHAKPEIHHHDHIKPVVPVKPVQPLVPLPIAPAVPVSHPPAVPVAPAPTLFEVTRPNLPVLPLGASFLTPVLPGLVPNPHQVVTPLQPVHPSISHQHLQYHHLHAHLLPEQHNLQIHQSPGLHEIPQHHHHVHAQLVPGQLNPHIHLQPEQYPHVHLQAGQHPHIHLQPEQHPHVHLQTEQHPHIHLQPEQHPHVHLQAGQHPHVHLQPEQHPHVHLQAGQQPHVHLQPEQHPHVHLQAGQHPHIHLQPEQHPHVHLQAGQHPHIHLQPEQHPHVHLQDGQHPHIHLQPEQHPHIHLQQEQHPHIHLQPEQHPHFDVQLEQNIPQTPVVPQQPSGLYETPSQEFPNPHTLFQQQLPGNVHHEFSQQINDDHSSVFIQQNLDVPNIQPGHTDLQLPLHLPQHPNYSPENHHQHQGIVRPSVSLEPPYVH